MTFSRSFRSLLLGTMLCLTMHAAVPVVAAPLDSRIERITSEGAARRAMWGVYAVDAKTGEVLADVNGTRLLVPASNRKIVATALITTAYKAEDRIKTELRATSMEGGVVRGNLIVMAAGDPSWTPALQGGASGTVRLRELAKAAKAAGLQRVDGDLVIDPGVYMDADPMPPGWSWEEFSNLHGSTASVFSVNQNLVSVSLAPSATGRPVDVTFPGGMEFFRVVNESMTTSAGSAPTLTLSRDPSGAAIRLDGGLPSGSNPVGRAIPASKPTELAARFFIEALSKEGIAVTGNVVIRRGAGRDAQTLASIEGATMAEIIALCNRESNNYLAESLYLLAAAKLVGRSSYTAAQAVEESYWKRIKADPLDVLAADGSGLSRKNAITPRALVAALRDRSDVEWFVDSLPVSGHSGTLRGRLGGPMAGRVKAKTGTLDGVSGLSGYVRTNSGRLVCFSVIANNYTSGSGPIRAAIDDVVEVLASR